MTSPVAVITNLTFGANDIQNLPGIFLELVEGAWDGLTVRGEDDVLLGVEGRFARNRVRDIRMLRLAGHVSAAVGSSEAVQRASFTNQMDQLRAWFDPRFIDVLSATFPDGTTRTINARPYAPVINQVVPAMAFVSITLESVDPLWETTEAGSS